MAYVAPKILRTGDHVLLSPNKADRKYGALMMDSEMLYAAFRATGSKDKGAFGVLLFYMSCAQDGSFAVAKETVCKRLDMPEGTYKDARKRLKDAGFIIEKDNSIIIDYDAIWNAAKMEKEREKDEYSSMVAIEEYPSVESTEEYPSKALQTDEQPSKEKSDGHPSVSSVEDEQPSNKKMDNHPKVDGQTPHNNIIQTNKQYKTMELKFAEDMGLIYKGEAKVGDCIQVGSTIFRMVE